MPLCSYQQAPDRNDRTVVENIFLREFMPAAPEGAVKAYLYGLMQCQQGTGAGSLSAFARDVALSETEVQDAFAYWQEKGLVLVQTKPMFAVFYLDIHNALPQDAGVYADAAYNREIQALFAPKAIQPAELARVYDWTDVFLIDRSAVPLLIEYGQKKLKDLDKATARRQVSYIDKIARQWNQEGVRAQEDAKAWLAAQAEQGQRAGRRVTAAGAVPQRHPAGARAVPKMAGRRVYAGGGAGGGGPYRLRAQPQL